MAKVAGRIVLGSALFWIGLTHLGSSRTEFQAQVPAWLPLNPDFVVLASGIAEMVLGVLIIFLRKALPVVGLATAVFFLLIFAGNINQYVHRIDAFGLNSDEARLGRLFFQPILIGWALWSTSSLRSLKNLLTLRSESKKSR